MAESQIKEQNNIYWRWTSGCMNIQYSSIFLSQTLSSSLPKHSMLFLLPCEFYQTGKYFGKLVFSVMSSSTTVPGMLTDCLPFLMWAGDVSQILF
jgi:hypothetical protein